MKKNLITFIALSSLIDGAKTKKMSLIAFTSNSGEHKSGYPYLIGDILFSSKEAANIILPTTLESSLNIPKANRPLYPAALKQKIYVISDVLAVALAGSEVIMKSVLSDIKTNFKYRECNIETVQNWCDNELENYDQNEVYAILMLASPKDGIRTWTFGMYLEGETEKFGHFIAMASGAEHFANFACQPVVYSGGAPQVEKPLETFAKHIILCGKLLTEEKLTFDPLKNAYGTSYKLITILGRKLQKVDNVTNVVLVCELDESNMPKSLKAQYVFNNKYHNNILVISVTNFVSSVGFVVGPLDVPITDEILKQLPEELNFSSKTYSITYILVYADRTYGVSTFFIHTDYYIPEQIPFQIIQEGAGFKINISPDYERHIYDFTLKNKK